VGVDAAHGDVVDAAHDNAVDAAHDGVVTHGYMSVACPHVRRAQGGGSIIAVRSDSDRYQWLQPQKRHRDLARVVVARVVGPEIICKPRRGRDAGDGHGGADGGKDNLRVGSGLGESRAVTGDSDGRVSSSARGRLVGMARARRPPRSGVCDVHTIQHSSKCGETRHMTRCNRVKAP